MRGRRDFLKRCGAAAGLAVGGLSCPAGAESPAADTEPFGVLVDTTRCVGCRRCEKACNDINTDLPRKDAASFADESVFGQRRRMDDTAYTVVNRFGKEQPSSGPVYAKSQCMHCLRPACASACIVGAFSKETTGAVRYDAWKCIGCRCCIVACPFQVPAYEYGNALTPQIRKCTLCHQTRLTSGQMPACVQSCPMEVMTFGKRSELLGLARARLQEHPGRYVPHVYGEHEVGGTSWLYLASVPFREIGLPKLGTHPIPGYTEPIQHAVFKWFLPPLGVYATLGGIWWCMSGRKKAAEEAPAT
jgi:formate dehydrogenase iron-sulfur subunit